MMVDLDGLPPGDVVNKEYYYGRDGRTIVDE